MCWCKAVIGDAAASTWPQNIKLLPSWGSENHQDIITIFWRRKGYDVVLLRHETETIPIVVQCVKYALLILLPKAFLHWSQTTGHPVLLQLPPRKATIIMWTLNLVESISGNLKSLKMDVGQPWTETKSVLLWVKSEYLLDLLLTLHPARLLVNSVFFWRNEEQVYSLISSPAEETRTYSENHKIKKKKETACRLPSLLCEVLSRFYSQK